MYREKKTISGKLLEGDFYPIWNDGRRMPSRAPKKKRSPPEQEKYNHAQAVKKAVRLVSTNFTTGDILTHLTYAPDCAPESEEEAKRDYANYIRRVKRLRERELREALAELARDPGSVKKQRRVEELSRPFKYYCCLEKTVYKTGRNAGRTNWHFHCFMTSGVSRDDIEDMWPGRTNADRFRPETFGPEAAARYITKDQGGARRILRSRNLEKPDSPPPRDGHITARGVEKLAKQRVDDAAYWEKRYKGYRFIRCYARYNNYNGHWYVSVVMYKAGDGDAPPWNMPDWQDE